MTDPRRLSTHEDLLALARAAGRSGRSWAEFTFDDDVQAYVDDHLDAFDAEASSAVEAAFAEGRREHRVAAGGWVTLWTVASVDYDGFGTETLEEVPWRDETLRRVLVDPGYLSWHLGRYGSCLGGPWTEDPRLGRAPTAAAGGA